MKLTAKQEQAQSVLAGPATHIMLFGGSRSGKTYLLTRNIVMRALKAPGSRHAVLRFRFNHVKNSIVQDTFPTVMRTAFPNVTYRLDRTDWYAELPNGSQIWFGGLDDKERTEKILGQEFATVYLNECSQIPQGSRDLAVTRLAQNVEQVMTGVAATPLKPRMYYDCVSGNTILDGQTKTIADLAKDGRPIKVLTSRGWRNASAPWKNGHGQLLEFALSSGKRITVTPSHRFWLDGRGWVRADGLAKGARLLCTDESRFPRDAADALPLRKTLQDWTESCCKRLRQCGGQLRRLLAGAQACLPSAFDARAHIRADRLAEMQGAHRGHQGQQESLRNRRTQWFRAPLWQSCDEWISRTARHCAQGISAPFQETRRFPLQFLESSYLQLPAASRFAFAHPSFAIARDATATHCAASIDRQWQPNIPPFAKSANRISWRSKAQATLLRLFSSSDTPDESRCWYETVDCIVLQPEQDFYTVEVPDGQHYVANGVVSHNCNPPSKAHWTYRLFVEKRDPETKRPIANAGDYAYFQINPQDNAENLPDGYLDTLKGLSARLQRRFLAGEYADATPNALFSEDNIDKWRVLDGKLPDMVRVVVAVDPSGSDDEDNADNDAIGIVVAGLGLDGNAYVLEDCTVKAGPATWGAVATTAYDRHEADVIVGEVNYGGAMVRQTIQVARPRTPFKEVRASRGKAVRAEPISALYEQGKVRHVGYFPELEDELSGFSTVGYLGDRSPNRADALIWALASLFPAMVKPPKEKKPVELDEFGHSRTRSRAPEGAWMA